MNCKKCKQQISDMEIYCSHCGNKIEKALNTNTKKEVVFSASCYLMLEIISDVKILNDQDMFNPTLNTKIETWRKLATDFEKVIEKTESESVLSDEFKKLLLCYRALNTFISSFNLRFRSPSAENFERREYAMSILLEAENEILDLGAKKIISADLYDIWLQDHFSV